MTHRKPVSGDDVFKALNGKKTIVMACNVRMTRGIAKGIMRSAKENDAVIIFEIARSESDLSGGYTGMTPKSYYDEIISAAHDVDHDMFVVHADHISIMKGDEQDLQGTKELIKHQIDAGYTCFAIDASHLFDFKGKDLREELADNIRCTSEIAHFIKENKGDETFGLEVEVGEIGKTDSTGRVLTSPDEAATFLTALKENDVHPNLLAIANGSAHGNTVDEYGKVIPQVSVDIPQTIAVSKAIKEAGLKVGIAQHGITGTPREIINLHFPKGDILKGNVGTHWQNIFYDVVKIYEPELYADMKEWVISSYKDKHPGKPDEVVWVKNAKRAFKPFIQRNWNLSKDTLGAMEAVAYSEANLFFRSFSAQGTASMVRDHIEGN
jgi:fructose-bisphosphate aldolase class II